MKRIIAIISIHCLPAILYLGYAYQMSDYYYGYTYILVGIAFLAISAGIAVYNIRNMIEFLQRSVSVLFFSMFFSWLTGLLVLGLLNMTPLCIGQDNGDGLNNFQDCVIQTVAGGIVHTMGMFFVIAVVALLGGWMLQKIEDRESMLFESKSSSGGAV